MKRTYHVERLCRFDRINSLRSDGPHGLRLKVFFSLLWPFVFVIFGMTTISAQTLKSVVFAVSATDVSASPIFVAEELGYLKAEGIDSKIVLIRSDIAMKGLVTGDVDFASSISSVVKASAIGAPIKTLINFFNGSFFYLVTRPGITNIEQLRGKTVAISRYGSATDFDARAAFRHFNLDPIKDVKLIAIGGGPTRIAALVSGHVDAAILNNIEKIPAEKAGMKPLLFTGQYLRQPVGGLGAGVQKMTDGREEIRKSIRAVYRALTVMKSDRNRVKATFAKRLDVKPENFDTIYDDAMRVFLPSGEIDLADLSAPYDDARKQAVNAPPVPLTSLVDYSILQEARKTIK
jgi:ABC-type nitrate/sulfonate/bicarbonate transport system substrate-binding protein